MGNSLMSIVLRESFRRSVSVYCLAYRRVFLSESILGRKYLLSILMGSSPMSSVPRECFHWYQFSPVYFDKHNNFNCRILGGGDDAYFKVACHIMFSLTDFEIVM